MCDMTRYFAEDIVMEDVVMEDDGAVVMEDAADGAVAECQRRHRGIYSIWGGRSLYCLHFSIGQLMGPEACFEMFVRVLPG